LLTVTLTERYAWHSSSAVGEHTTRSKDVWIH